MTSGQTVRSVVPRSTSHPAMEIEFNFEFSNVDEATHAYQTMADKDLTNIVGKFLQKNGEII